MKRTLCCCVVTAFFTAASAGAPAGQPIPAKAEIDTARASLRTAYADVFERATANPLVLVDTLVDAAEKETLPADKCALFLEAEDWAIRGGDYSRAMELIDRRAKAFDLDGVAEQVLMLQKVTKELGKLQDPDRLRDLFRHTKDTVERALANDALDQAAAAAECGKKCAVSLSTIGKKTRLPGLVDEGNTRQGEANALLQCVEARKKRQAEYRKATALLQLAPDDTDANWTVGRYLCFVLGRRSEGLAALAKSGQPEVVGLATAEMELMKTKSRDTAKVYELADKWWALTETTKPPKAISEASEEIRRHSAYLYEMALPRIDNPRLRQHGKQRIDAAVADGPAPRWREGYFKIHRLVATKQHGSGWEALYHEIEFIDADSGKRLQGGKASALPLKGDPKRAEESAELAFDGSVQTFHDTCARPAESGHWIQYAMPFPVKVGAVRILQSGGGNHIFDVDLQGSNDGEVWTTIQQFKDLPEDFRTPNYRVPAPVP